MKRPIRIIAIALIIVAGSSAIYAYSKHNHWGMSPEEKVEFVSERVTRKLDLDNQQQQNFTDLAGSFMQIMQEAKITKDQNLTEIEALLQEPNFNQARALELIREKTNMINEKAPIIISSLAVFLDSLSIEQKQEMQKFVQHRHKHRRHEDKHHRYGDND